MSMAEAWIALKASEHVVKEMGKLNERIMAERDAALAELAADALIAALNTEGEG